MQAKKIAVVLNGFIHDFATGYWLSSLMAIRFLHSFQGKHASVSDLLGIIERFFFWNSIGAMVAILATGAGRSFTYVDNVFGEQTEQTRRTMLIVKHVILFLIFGAGSWWTYGMTFLQH
ncbi:MAG: hypothetical protein A2X58_03255 [Nitrospirae bacterium GWC2_56_14]|nr:MAG: hypothetical protein A2X58_03255 [Nitrospirae bacterium GWC2_56_14]